LDILNRRFDFLQLTIYHRINSDLPWQAAEFNEMPLRIHRTYLQKTVVPNCTELLFSQTALCGFSQTLPTQL